MEQKDGEGAKGGNRGAPAHISKSTGAISYPVTLEAKGPNLDGPEVPEEAFGGGTSVGWPFRPSRRYF